MVRIGIGLYGLSYDEKYNNFINTIELTAPVLNISKIKKGETIGYNSTFTADKDMVIACIGIGYADGLNVNISNNFSCHYKGIQCDVIGRISMDSMVIDISAIQDIFIGDYITVFDTPTNIDKMAINTNIPTHNVLTGLGGRIKKVYKQG